MKNVFAKTLLRLISTVFDFLKIILIAIIAIICVPAFVIILLCVTFLIFLSNHQENIESWLYDKEKAIFE